MSTGAGTGATGPGDAAPIRPRTIRTVCLVLVLLPVAVALFELPRLSGSDTPAGDFALIELQVRDIGRYAVFLGPYSRFGWNHPGPALFFLLAPFSRLVGGASIGVALGALAINAGALVGCVLVAFRRAGRGFTLAVTLGLLLLVRGLGVDALISAWNPTVTVLPLVLLALLVWSVAEGDRPMLPLVVFVASFLVQSHVGTAPIVGALVLWLVVEWALRIRHDPVDTEATTRNRRIAIVSVIVGVVVWALPLWQQFTTADGNMTRILDFTRATSTGRYGAGLHAVLNQFTFRPEWATGSRTGPAPFVADVFGTAPVPWLLIPVGIAVSVAWRRRWTAELRLLALLGTGLLGCIAATGRIYGLIFTYLVQWTWALAMLTVVTAGWILVRAWLRPLRWVVVPTAAVLVSLLAIGTAARTFDIETPLPRESATVQKLTPALLAAVPRAESLRLTGGTSRLGSRTLYGLGLQAELHGRELAQPPGDAYKWGAHRTALHPDREVVVVTKDTPKADYGGSRRIGSAEGVSLYLRNPE